MFLLHGYVEGSRVKIRDNELHCCIILCSHIYTFCLHPTLSIYLQSWLNSCHDPHGIPRPSFSSGFDNNGYTVYLYMCFVQIQKHPFFFLFVCLKSRIHVAEYSCMRHYLNKPNYFRHKL